MDEQQGMEAPQEVTPLSRGKRLGVACLFLVVLVFFQILTLKISGDSLAEHFGTLTQGLVTGSGVLQGRGRGQNYFWLDLTFKGQDGLQHSIRVDSDPVEYGSHPLGKPVALHYLAWLDVARRDGSTGHSVAGLIALIVDVAASALLLARFRALLSLLANREEVVQRFS